jgi:hypothetical protein
MTTGARSRRRWPYLLLLVALLLAALLVAEAAGLTRLVEAAQDYRRGHGTLVVEAEDAEVRIAGQGRLHQGEGTQEVRLPPGRYEVRVGTAGRVWCEQSVELEHDERVVLACQAPPRPDWVGGRPFVLPARGQRLEVGFDTLAEAAAEAEPGDTVEIRGNGPFVGPPLVLDRPLTIRAGAGYRPVLRMNPESTGWYLQSAASLVLEGLDLDGWTTPAEEKKYRPLLACGGQVLLVANCRLRVRGPSQCIQNGAGRCEVRNCEFFCVPWQALTWVLPATGSLAVDNCLFIRCWLGIEMDTAVPRSISARLTRNTWAGSAFALEVRLYKTDLPGAVRPVRLDVKDNVFQYTQTFTFSHQWLDTPLTAGETEVLSKRLLAWNEKGNVYPHTLPLFTFARRGRDIPGSQPIKDLADWRKFWDVKGDSGSSQAVVRFAGAGLENRLNAEPEKVVPEDFRLRPDSPGRGKGADVSLVGPGKAYERWKKTKEYALWQKQAGQLR